GPIQNGPWPAPDRDRALTEVPPAQPSPVPAPVAGPTATADTDKTERGANVCAGIVRPPAIEDRDTPQARPASSTRPGSLRGSSRPARNTWRSVPAVRLRVYGKRETPPPADPFRAGTSRTPASESAASTHRRARTPPVRTSAVPPLLPAPADPARASARGGI